MDKALNHLWEASCSCHYVSFHVEYIPDSSYHDLNSCCESDVLHNVSLRGLTSDINPRRELVTKLYEIQSIRLWNYMLCTSIV